MAIVHEVPADSSVIITGAARGIGTAIADRFATDGYRVVAVDQDAEGLEKVVTSLPGEGHVAVVGDVVSEAVMESAADRAGADGHALRAIVLNAGVIRVGPSTEYDLADWDLVHNVMLKGSFVGARVAARHMTGGGSVVMISSLAGTLGLAERAAYCAAKAGVQGLVRSLAVEWARDGIRVNAIAPGTIATDMQQSMLAQGFASADAYLANIPMNRFGRPEEIADGVAFLASSQSAYVTGQILAVDGGWVALGLDTRS